MVRALLNIGFCDHTVGNVVERQTVAPRREFWIIEVWVTETMRRPLLSKRPGYVCNFRVCNLYCESVFYVCFELLLCVGITLP